MFCLVIIWISNPLLAQENAVGRPTPYLNLEFKTGTLYYKETEPQEAELNYHKVGEEMVMKLREHMVPINEIETVDSIRLGNALFVRIEDQFYQELLSGPYQFLVKHRATSQKAAKIGAYGSTAHTGGVETPLAIEERIEFYALTWAEHQAIIDRTEYFIKRGERWHKANTAKQFISVFPDRKKEIKQLLAEHKIKFDRPDDVRRALVLATQ